MGRYRTVVLAAALVAITAAGQMVAQPVPPPPPAPAPAPAPTDADVLMTIEGQPVRKRELVALMLKTQGQEALLGLVTRRLIEADVSKQQIVVTQQEIDDQIKRTTEQMGGPDLLAQVLQRRGMSQSDLASDVKLELSLRKLVQKQELVTVGEADMQRLFQQQHGERLFIQLILVRDQKAANDLAKQIQGGEDFGLLAQQYSQDANTARVAGQLGPVWRGFMTETNLEDALFALKPGQVSPVIAGRYGYYIFKLNKRVPPDNASYEQLKDELSRQALEIKIRDRTQLYLTGVRQRAQRLIDDAKIKF